MTTTPALTPTGIVVPSATDTKDGLDASFASVYGASILVNGSIPAATSIGQEVAIIDDALSGRDEFTAALYAAFDINQAVTPQLQILCGLTGTTQSPALPSTAVVACLGTNGTILPVGRVVTVSGTGSRFDSTAAGTLATVATTWASLTAYALYDTIINGGYLWVVTVPGTSSVATPPTGGGTVTEGTVTWYALGADTLAVALVPFSCDVNGAIGAQPHTLANIATPISGWASANNPLAATLGQSLETEAHLRAKQQQELQAPNGGTNGGIRAAFLQLPTVTSCVVYENDGDVPDGAGRPPHSIEVVVEDSRAITAGTNLALAQVAWNAKGAGIQTTGNVGPITVQDASGTDQTVYFSRPVAVPIWIKLTVIYNSLIWTGVNAGTNVSAAVKSALGTYFAGLSTGFDVRASQIAGAVEDGPQQVDSTGTPIIPAPAGSVGAPGILGVANYTGTDATLPLIGIAPAPATSATIPISYLQVATLDLANVSINPVAGTP